MGVLLSFLWIQICCELRTSQRDPAGISQVNLEKSKEGKERWRKRENTSVLDCILSMRMEIRENFLTLGNRYSHFAVALTCAICFSIRVRSQMNVKESPGILILQQRRNFSLTCTFFLSPNQCALVPTKS